MGSCCSTPEPPPKTPTPLPPTPEVPKREGEDPKYIFLTAMVCLGRTVDPDISVDEVKQFCQENQEYFYSFTYCKGYKIFEPGDTVEAIYVVISGELSVFDMEKNEEVLRIFSKDFYMDVEVLYNRESIYDVSAFTETEIWKVPIACVTNFLRGHQLPPIAKWFVWRRYPASLPELNKSVVDRQICITVMKQVPLFSKWTDSTIEGFIDFMGATPMNRYAPGSTIVKKGTQCDDMMVVVRGRTNFLIFDDYFPMGQHQDIFSIASPFTLFEKGVFADGAKHQISVFADTTCYIITINKHWIHHASEHVWEFADGAEPHWSNTVIKWNEIIKERRNTPIYNGPYASYLSIELIFQWLKMTPSFRRCQSNYVYELAKCGDSFLIGKDDHFAFKDLKKGCLLVVRGSLQLVTQDQLEELEVTPHHIYSERDLIYYSTLSDMPLYLQACEDCLLVQFPLEDIRREMKGLVNQPIDFLDSKNN